MMLLLENLKLALSAIRVNKMRSFLTMLGIIIGISAVIAIVSIGDTMRSVIADVYNDVGINRVLLYVGYVEDYRMSDDFTLDDMETVREAFSDRIEYIDPSYSDSVNISHSNTTLKASVSAIAADYDKSQPMNILYGRMINQSDINSAKHHIVIEDKTALKLYGRTNVVGETLKVDSKSLGKEDFLIVGVYQVKQSFLTAMMTGGGGYETAYAPYSVFLKDGDYFWTLNCYVKDGTDYGVLETQMKGLVSRMKNREPEQIVFYAAKDEMGSMDSMMSAMSMAVGAIAAISLLVGGIGIMNIMLVSVTERTREIGIRKALGAKTQDILIQFLIESALISAAGGVIGTILGIGVVALGGLALGIAVVVNPMIVVIAVAFSAVVGIFFGIYPARKAAMSDPIEALRYE